MLYFSGVEYFQHVGTVQGPDHVNLLVSLDIGYQLIVFEGPSKRVSQLTVRQASLSILPRVHP